ncbi:MAG: YfiR family protein [Ignavibacteriales bacterium]|nr:YfiR family protein [Ignavibacteriales bacterium]
MGMFVALGSNVLAQTVPATLQAALLKKIFSFDKSLSGKAAIDVVVIGSADDVVAALNAVGMKAKSGSEVGGDVVYVAAGATPPKAASAKAGILSVSASTAFVEKGQVSVAIGLEDGKPKIYVNLGQLKAEKHELSADLLKLAKIIQ